LTEISSPGIGRCTFTEVKSSLYGKSDAKIYGFIAGLGGKIVHIFDIENICKKVINGKAKDFEWYGLEGCRLIGNKRFTC